MKKIRIKLVRDRIPELIEKNHFPATFYTADEKEYQQRLREKLQEEVTEYLEGNTIEELVDIIEVIYALAQLSGFSPAQLETFRNKKAKESGTFSKRLIIKYEK